MNQDRIDREIKHALSFVIPTKEETEKMETVKGKIMNLVNDQVEHVRKSIVCNYTVYDPILVGSFSKGTWLSGEADLDIFIPFKPDGINVYGISPDGLKKVGLEIGMKALKDYKPYTRYAEHPFTEAVIDGVKVNIVPCYDTPIDKLITTVDRTPHHTRFMNGALSESQKNDVRLLKKFMKIRKIYGAEIETKGFSGYACEALVHYCGSFQAVLNEFANHVKLHHKFGFNGEGKNFDNYTPIIITDPIDSTRNLGSAISMENVGKMIHYSRLFLFNPQFMLHYSKNVLGIPSCIKLTYDPKLSKDNVVGQAQHIASMLEMMLHKFEVIQKNVTSADGIITISFLTCTDEIPKYKIKNGPIIFKKEWSEPFTDKNGYKPVTIDQFGRLVIIEIVQETKLSHVLLSSINEILKNYPLFTLNYAGDSLWYNGLDEKFLFTGIMD